MDTEQLLTLIFEWQKIIMTRLGVRRYLHSTIMATMTSNPIKIITGFRRSGKSYLVQQVAKTLIETGIFPLKNVLYLNFEDYQLMDIQSLDQLNNIYQLFLQHSAAEGKKLLIFDEIQHVPNWDKFIRTLYEKNNNLQIIITGSNSELLSSELGSNLAGRFIEFFLLPFSFQEYLEYQNMTVTTKTAMLRNKLEIESAFATYLRYGGLPETFSISLPEAKTSYLEGIMKKIILDDIVKRFKIERIDILEKLWHYICSTAGNTVSFATLQKKLIALNWNVKTETVTAYVNYFVKAFALIDIVKFNWKQTKVFSTSKKYYVVDQGLLNLTRPFEENYSYRLENVILLELFRRFPRPIYYGANDAQREIDFIVQRNPPQWEKYQITTQLHAENWKRELDVFSLSDPHLTRGKNIILTMDNGNENIEINNIPVRRNNIISWCCGID